MVLCCAIPLAGILVLSYLGILVSWGVYALILLCPLLHFLFMRKMMGRETSGKSEASPMPGEDNLFGCPCQAGGFNRVGEIVSGPPPRPLDLYELSIVKGNLVVDLGKIVERKKFDPLQVVRA